MATVRAVSQQEIRDRILAFIDRAIETHDEGMAAWSTGVAIGDAAEELGLSKDTARLAAAVVNHGDQMLAALSTLQMALHADLRRHGGDALTMLEARAQRKG